MKSAAIVLGGGLDKITKSNKTYYYPPDQVKERLDTAYKLLQQKKIDFIITSGKYSKRVGIDDNVQGPKTEAEVGKCYLIEKNKTSKVSISSIEGLLLAENKSYDTLGNAWYSKKYCLVPNLISEVTIITSDYHMERSRIIFNWVLGNDYKIRFISLPTYYPDKELREKLEKIFSDYFKTWLIPYIKAGDDPAIEKYLKNEHLIYSMSQRSEALFNACLETAAIKAGY